MAGLGRKPNLGKNDGPPKLEGDTVYEITTDVEVNGADVTMSTETCMDGKVMFAAKLDWYGLPPEMQAKFKEAIDKHGIKSEVVRPKSFRKTLNLWSRQIKALASINKAGHDIFEAEKKKNQKVLDDEPRESLTL